SIALRPDQPSATPTPSTEATAGDQNLSQRSLSGRPALRLATTAAPISAGVGPRPVLMGLGAAVRLAPFFAVLLAAGLAGFLDFFFAMEGLRRCMVYQR